MKEFIIIFRECLEAGLIVGIIYTYINFNNIKGQKRNIWLGVLGGVVRVQGGGTRTLRRAPQRGVPQPRRRVSDSGEVEVVPFARRLLGCPQPRGGHRQP